MNVPKIIPYNAKVWLLERIIKNLYHAKEITYRFHNLDEENMNNNYGYITLKDVDEDKIPKICDMCDSGLSQELDTEVLPDNFRREFCDKPDALRGAINVDIWFNFDPYVEIDRLKKLAGEE